MILITHDTWLIELVADRLWLVKDGEVAPYEGDMEAYRALLLSAQGRPARREADKPKSGSKDRAKPRATPKDKAALRAEVRVCEARLDKILAWLQEIDERLADPDLYRDDLEQAEKLQRKRAEIVAAQARAEALWMAAEEALDAAS